MTQDARRQWLLEALLRERDPDTAPKIPQDIPAQKRLLRGLLNVRPPAPVSPEFLQIQDAYLTAEREARPLTSLDELKAVENHIYLWKGDITALRVDAIVNAANETLLGCFIPCHGCIDNAIHSAAGVQLRQACAALMRAQGHPEPTGQAKLTPGFNLPARYVLHTVGPIVRGALTPIHRAQLASCYCACLTLAREHGLQSVAFCCISTGEFHFPNLEAARIAVGTVRDFLRDSPQGPAVIFNVFQEKDYEIYRSVLCPAETAAR